MSEAQLAPATITEPIAGVLTKAAVKAPKSRPKMKDTWWRHVVGIIAIVVSLFPVVYIVSSSFSANRHATIPTRWRHQVSASFGRRGGGASSATGGAAAAMS